MNDDEIKDRQLNALVGAAVRGLVESGANDEDVGAFAASYRMKAAKLLGHPQEALNPPDLTEVINDGGYSSPRRRRAAGPQEITKAE